MKKAMKQLFQKGISGILCAAMILTSLSIPEMTAYATETEITEETENADVTNEEGTEAEVPDEGSDKEDANSEAGEGDSADKTDAPDEDASGDSTDETDAPDEDASEGSEDETPNEDASEGSTGESAPEADKDNNSIDSAEVNYSANEGDVVTLNYYYGETGKTLGVSTWVWAGLKFPGDSTWSDEKWELGDNWSATVCLMQESEEYAGWYSIELEVGKLSESGIGFEIHSSDDSKKAVFKCGDGGENSTIYDQLVSGDATSYAVKNGKCYADTKKTDDDGNTTGEDLVTDIMRNVTLHVYSASGVPSIVLNGGLSYIDEEAGSKKSYTKSGTADNKDSYNMTKDTGNWYKLTFIAPNPALVGAEGSKTGADMCQLYIDGKWNKDFVNGPTAGNHQVDFTPVFAAGKTCYANAEFFDESVLRNVTLYVYSKNKVPAIMSTTKLSYLDVPATGAASVKQLTEDDEKSNSAGESEWHNYFYDMKEDTGGWYTLTFIAPDPALVDKDGSKTGAKMCELYIKNTEGSDPYEWKKNFMNGPVAGSTTYDVDFTPVFAGNVYYRDGAFYAFKDISIGDLKALLAEANAIKKKRYTDTSWEALQTAIANTEEKFGTDGIFNGKPDTYTDNDSTTENDTTLTTTYTDLKAAIDGLTIKDAVKTTFYYYAGDTNGKEVGIYHWCSNNNITSDAATAGFKAWGTTDIWKMEPAGYSGWYTIDFTLSGSEKDNSNFQIFIGSAPNNAVFKCGSEENPDGKANYTIYEEIFSGESAYAVKSFGSTNKIYSGETEVNAAMREVTLYVYNESGMPAIGSGSKLSKVNATSGAIEELTTSSTDSGVNYYNMASVTGKENWYSLTFSAPVPAESSHEICKLYTYNNSEYAPVKTFTDNDPADGDTNSVNFSKVFSGSVYYNGGQFYKSMELAEAGITLKMLRDYVNSEPVKTVVANSQTYYTEATWAAFNTAKTKADTLIASLDGADESTKSQEITEAYDELMAAVEAMKKQDTAVTFYYYNDSIAADEDLGLMISDDDQSYSTADKADWCVWNTDDTYKMTAVEGYPGWYSIPIVFVEEGTTYRWWRISSHKEGAAEKDTKQLEVFDQNVPTLDDATAFAYKSRFYVGEELVNLLKRNVSLYVYDETTAPAVETANKITAYVDESNGKKVAIADTAAVDGVYHYDMKITEDTGWYNFKFAAPQAGDNKEIGKVSGGAGSDLTLTLIEGVTTEPNSVNLTQYFGKSLYYKDGQIYDVRPYTVDELKALIKEAEKLRDDDLAAEEDGKNKYYHDSKEDEGKWDNFVSKIAAADIVAKKTNPTDDEIKEVYDALRAAMKALVRIPQEAESISVKRVALEDDFITGADLSSYASLKESGTIFKDENGNALSDEGFFHMLHEGGTNWVRIRVWNDPYNSNGNGYGGGNSDLEKAKIIGKLASAEGMKVLIDFHYSDFWADPSKQDAPKAWKNYDIGQKEEAVYNYTLNSLRALSDAGVDVGMVQVGNETNNAICGEKTWTNMARIYNSGSKAVKDFDPECLVAVHFADPSSTAFDGYAGKLAEYGVEYDVFAASYYPFWHGGIDNVTTKLGKIAQDYSKKVMVAETSWVTTWEDGDGHDNTSPKTTQTLPYPVSLQGQADEMRAVIEAVNKVNVNVSGNPAIGVFYWEPAWISPYYVYNSGSIDQSLYNKNKELWEKYGSGWASSYAAEYDPTDAGRWYGGSAVDNQAWFDFNGKAIETYKTYSYIRTGAVATNRKNSISSVEKEIELKLEVGDTIKLPDGKYEYNENDEVLNADEEVVITFSDGVKASDDKDKTHYKEISIEWDEEQQALANTDTAAVYTIDGVVKCEYYTTVKDANSENEPESKIAKYDVTLTIEVLSTSNILENAGFEDLLDKWVTRGEGINVKTGNNPYQEFYKNTRNGSAALPFWKNKKFNFEIEQTISPIKPGIYTAGGFIEGNGASSKDVQTLYVKVTDKDGKVTKYEATCSLNGWLNWSNPEISNVKVSEGDVSITVGMAVKSSIAEAWGSIDDMYLYGKYGINIGDIKNGIVNVSNMEADSGEVVRIAAMPENGYYLSKLELSGDDVAKDTLKDESGLAKDSDDTAYTDAKSVLIYNNADNKSDETIRASFKMPKGTVTLNAEFTQVPLTSVPMNEVVAKDFELTGDKNIYKITQEYTGKKIELDLDLSYKGYKLTNADYTAKYKNNVNKTTGENMAEITVTAKGRKFTGNKKLYFKIADTKADISKGVKAVLKGSDVKNGNVTTYYYTGEEIEPKIEKLTGESAAAKALAAMTLVEGTDYEIYYQNNIKVGTAKMIVIAKSDSENIRGSFTQTFKIGKRPIADSNGALTEDITITAPSGGIYTGSKIMPNVTVKYGSKVLQKGKDYTITYKNNVNVSDKVTDKNKKPSLKIKGKGNYTGVTKEYNFEISAKSIGDYGMKVTANDILKDKTTKITVKNGTKSLALNKQYKVKEIVRIKNEKGESVAGENPIKLNEKITKAGRYKVTVEGMGNYKGENSAEFAVTDKDHMMSNMKVEVVKSVVFTGSEIRLTTTGTKPQLKVTQKNSTTALAEGDDYEVSYEDAKGDKTNIKAGTAKVTIKGKGLYAGTKTVTFKITKSPMVKAGAATADKTAIGWEPTKDTLLYNINRNLDENEELYLPYTGYKWTPELNVYVQIGDANDGEESARKYLTKGKDYTISYTKNLKPGDKATVTIKGKGNYSGTVKFENAFTVKDVTLDDFVVTINPVEYNGKALKPAINFVYKATGTVVNMKAGTAYSVKYKNNKNVASIESATKPTVTITEKGLNSKKTGTAKGKDFYFTITTARITASSVSEVKIQTYNGKPSKPALTIKVNGKKLKVGTDYVVIYEGNTRPNDKATAKIIGVGNYSGTVNKTFVIK